MLFIGSTPYVTPENTYRSDVNSVERTRRIQRVFNNLLHIDTPAGKHINHAAEKLPEEPGMLIDIFG